VVVSLVGTCVLALFLQNITHYGIPLRSSTDYVAFNPDKILTLIRKFVSYNTLTAHKHNHSNEVYIK
jgi:hypothetical protein